MNPERLAALTRDRNSLCHGFVGSGVEAVSELLSDNIAQVWVPELMYLIC